MSNYTASYVTLVTQGKDQNLSQHDKLERPYYIEQLVDDYSRDVERLSNQEWQQLFNAVCHYFDTVS